jgi:uncharacterized membrane protein
MAVAGWSVQHGYIGVSWCVLSLLLLEAGRRGWPRELWYPALATWCAGAIHVCATHFDVMVKFPGSSVYWSFIGAALSAWAIAARSWRNALMRDGFAVAGSVFALPAIWMVTPEPFVTVAWTAVAVVALETGIAVGARRMQWIGQGLMLPVFLRALFVDLRYEQLLGGIPERVLMVLPAVLVLYYFWGRARSFVHLWTGGFLMLALMQVELGPARCGLGWSLFAVVLMIAGLLRGARALRVQACTVALSVFVLAMFNNLIAQADLAADAVAIASVYAMAWMARRLIDSERHTGRILSAGASVLLATVLFNQVSGSVLTVAWGLEGVLLLGAGFALRTRFLRLQGLAVLLACILKLFLHDLRNLETLYRILSFIALGVILLGVSWIYTRFREQVKRYF